MTDAPTIAPGPAPIITPPLAPPNISLLTAANVITSDDGVQVQGRDRWLSGITYMAEGLGMAQVIALSGATKTPITGCPDVVSWLPFAILAGYKTGTFNLRTNDVRARATRALLAHESRLIEAQLWDNDSAIDDDQPSIILGADTVGTGAVSLAKAIATMEQALADAGHSGSPMMFHMRPYLFDLLLNQSAIDIRREGNKYYTALDNIIVPGRGYKGTGPMDNINDTPQAVGATEWMYATAPVEIRRGRIDVFPSDKENGETVDRVENNITAFAERAVLAGFDTTAPHLALEVTT